MPPRVTCRTANEVAISSVEPSAYEIPTDSPEADGTLDWTSTTLVIVEVEAAGARGLGYSYTHAVAVPLIADLLAEVVRGRSAMDVAGAWVAMQRAVRNVGRPGIGAAAIAAVDSALWDLKARLLDVALVTLLGAVRTSVPVYGSGGFTSYSIDQLTSQLTSWVEDGIRGVKMKVGRDQQSDPVRVRAAREAIGEKPELFVDANGAWTPAAATAMAHEFAKARVSWFEEPVSSDDLDGLRQVKERAPLGCEIAAGEYGYDIVYFRRMLGAGAVDVLQADATRCGGITGFLQVGALCDGFAVPLSSHTAPALHAAPCCAVPRVRHAEYFHDHVRIEARLFDGVPPLRDGTIVPDVSSPGMGLTLKHADAASCRVA